MTSGMAVGTGLNELGPAQHVASRVLVGLSAPRPSLPRSCLSLWVSTAQKVMMTILEVTVTSGGGSW